VNLYDEVKSRIDQFTSESNILVSSETADILVNILNAINNDPHPLWQGKTFRIGSETLVFGETPLAEMRLFDWYLESIPKMLNSVVESEGIRRRPRPNRGRARRMQVTTFDLLHYLAQAADKRDAAWACIIKK